MVLLIKAAAPVKFASEWVCALCGLKGSDPMRLCVPVRKG